MARRIYPSEFRRRVIELIESAKLCGVEPRAYLRDATLRTDRDPGTVTLAADLKWLGSPGTSRPTVYRRGLSNVT
jgi:hypothetical protein